MFKKLNNAVNEFAAAQEAHKKELAEVHAYGESVRESCADRHESMESFLADIDRKIKAVDEVVAKRKAEQEALLAAFEATDKEIPQRFNNIQELLKKM
jgi:DNA-binding protein H-NS